MKNISLTIAAITIVCFTSCYVGVNGGHRHRHPHGAAVIIHASDDSIKKDSLQSPAMSNSNKNDSLKTPVNPDVVK